MRRYLSLLLVAQQDDYIALKAPNSFFVVFYCTPAAEACKSVITDVNTNRGIFEKAFPLVKLVKVDCDKVANLVRHVKFVPHVSVFYDGIEYDVCTGKYPAPEILEMVVKIVKKIEAADADYSLRVFQPRGDDPAVSPPAKQCHDKPEHEENVGKISDGVDPNEVKKSEHENGSSDG